MSIRVPRTSARSSSLERCTIATTGHGFGSAEVLASVHVSVVPSATVLAGQVRVKSSWVTVIDESESATPTTNTTQAANTTAATDTAATRWFGNRREPTAIWCPPSMC